MKIVIIILAAAVVSIGCGQTTKNQTETTSDTIDILDTVIIKHKNILNETSIFSKTYSYYWLVGKDTLDFIVYASEWKSDSALWLRLFHKKPMLFSDALSKIDMCLPLIKEDFDVSKFKHIHFNPPIYYLDVAKKLSNEYEQKFGRKNVSYERFVQFLLQSSLNLQLNDFFKSLDKKVKHYGFEKFFLIDKKYYEGYLPNTDFTEYPEFTFNAHTGISVSLENIKAELCKKTIRLQ